MRQALVKRIIEMRVNRDNFLPQWLFGGEAAWDMLLELYRARLTGSSVELEALTAAAMVPSCVSSRWLRALQRANLVVVTKHMLNGPEIVAISEEGYRALDSYFDTLAVTMSGRANNS